MTRFTKAFSARGTSGGAADGQARSLSRAATAVRDLHPGYFAFVMATGIISTGTFLLGPRLLSRALLAAGSAGLLILTMALVARLACFRSSVAADFRAPDRVFGFFTVTAGLDVRPDRRMPPCSRAHRPRRRWR